MKLNCRKGAAIGRWGLRWGLVVSLLAVGALSLVGQGGSGGGITTRVSVASDGSQGNGGSGYLSISADGRYVAFLSFASNLVSGDTNGQTDVFVHDRLTATTTRVSVASDGSQANRESQYVSISADGRFVVFSSQASNLVSGDTNGQWDVFVHDRQTATTTRVSLASDDSQSNGHSTPDGISSDGRYVAFTSTASNLVSGDTNNTNDAFVRDRQTGTTTRVSVASDGSQGNDQSSASCISADGRFVAFGSAATNLVSGDTAGEYDSFVHDRQTGTTTRVSVATDGSQGNDQTLAFSLSADGRYVALASPASNLVSGDTNGHWDVFVHDRQTATTTRVSLTSEGAQANGFSFRPSISADGRYVAFDSDAANLVSDDTNGTRDVFIHDRHIGSTTLISVSSNGSHGNDESGWPSITADSGIIAFLSDATNLVSGDTNAQSDIFVHERRAVSLVPSLSASPRTIPANGTSQATLALNYFKDDGGVRVGHTVRFSSQRSAGDVFDPPTAVISANGTATTRVSSLVPGVAQISVVDETTSTTLPVSTHVTFTNPNDPNPAADGVSQTYESQGPFCKEMAVSQTVTVEVSDWKGAPGRVEFDLNGTKKSVPASGSTVSTTYDLGKELKYSPSGTWNTLTITAFNAAGRPSLTSVRRWLGMTLPDCLAPSRWVALPTAFYVGNGVKFTFGVDWPEVNPNEGKGNVNAPQWLMRGSSWGRTYGKFVAEVELELEASAYPAVGFSGTGTFKVGVGYAAKFNRPAGTPKGFFNVGGFEWETLLAAGGKFDIVPTPRLSELSVGVETDFGIRTPDIWWMTGVPALDPVLDLYGKIKIEADGKFVWTDSTGSFTYKTAEVPVKTSLSLNLDTEGQFKKWLDLHVEIGGSAELIFQLPGNAANAAFFGTSKLHKAITELWASGYIRANIWFLDYDFDFSGIRGHWEVGPGDPRPAPRSAQKGSGGWRQPRRGYHANGRSYHQLADEPAKHPFQPWLDNPGVAARNGGIWDVAETRLILNVFDSMTPDLAWKNGRATVVFPYDDPGLPANQSTEIRALHQTASGWEEKAVTDDTELDSQPQIVVTPSGQQLAVFTRTIGVNLTDTPAQRLPKHEIAFAVYNETTQSWGATSRLTNNTRLDFNPQLHLGADGKLYLTWLQCPDGIFPTQFDDPILPHTDLYVAVWNGATFVYVQRSVARADTTDRVALVVNPAGVPLLVFSRDRDGNKATQRDDALYFVTKPATTWSAPVRVNSETASQGAPAATIATNGNVVLFYARTGVPHPLQPDHTRANLAVTTYSSSWSTPTTITTDEAINGVEVLASPTGAVSAMWVSSSERSSDLWTTTYDGVTGTYSLPVRLTDDEFQEKNIAAAWDPAGNPSAVYTKTLIEKQNRTVYDASNNPYTVVANVPTVCDLYLLSHTPRPDLAVTELTATPSNAGPGEAVTLRATVSNLRTKGAPNVVVRFYDGDPSAGGVIIQSLYVTPRNVPGGSSGAASVNWVVPDDGRGHTIYAVADPYFTVTETDETNNQASLALLGLDHEALPPQVVQYLPDGRVSMQLGVRNASSVRHVGSLTWQLWRGPKGTGVLLKSGEFAAPLPSTTESTSFVWNPVGLNPGDYEFTFVIDEAQATPDTDRTNDTATQTVKLRADLAINPHNGLLTMGAGGSATAYVTIQNLGWASTPPVVVSAYDRSPFAAGAVLLGTRTIAGLSRFANVSTSIVMPAVGSSGQVWVMVNPSGSIVEVRKDNNETVFTAPTLASFSNLSAPIIFGGTKASFLVQLTHPAPISGTQVALTSSSALVPVPATITVPAGASSFVVTSQTITGGSTTATLTARLGSVTRTFQIMVRRNPILLGVSVTPSSVVGGNPVQGSVLMDAPPPHDLPVAPVLSDDSLYAVTPSNVFVPFGSSSATFGVSTSSVTSQQSVTLTAAYFGVVKTTTFLILPAGLR